MSAETNIAVVVVDRDLDVTCVDSVRRHIDSLIETGCRRIVMSLAGADYVDSAGMGLILCELRRMRSLGGLISLVGVRPRVYQSLCLMRMSDFLPISRFGVKAEVNELDPSVLPEWRTTFCVDAGRLEAARARLEELLGGLPLSSDAVFDLKLASGEAVGNAVDHTDEGGVLVTVAAYADRVCVDIADNGQGFLPDDLDDDTLDAFAERGRGIRLMKLLADSVSIEPKTSGQGTVVRLVKMFSSPEAQTSAGN